MRTFALTWLVVFAVAVPVAIRVDRRRRIRRAWAEITTGTQALGEAFASFGSAAGVAAETIRQYRSAWLSAAHASTVDPPR